MTHGDAGAVVRGLKGRGVAVDETDMKVALADARAREVMRSAGAIASFAAVPLEGQVVEDGYAEAMAYLAEGKTLGKDLPVEGRDAAVRWEYDLGLRMDAAEAAVVLADAVDGAADKFTFSDTQPFDKTGRLIIKSAAQFITDQPAGEKICPRLGLEKSMLASVTAPPGNLKTSVAINTAFVMSQGEDLDGVPMKLMHAQHCDTYTTTLRHLYKMSVSFSGNKL